MEAQDTQNSTPVATESQQQPAAVPENTAPAQAQATPQTPGCTGNCKNCTSFQRNYCAAQIGFNMQNVLAGLMARLEGIQESVGRLADEVTALKKKSEEQPAIIEAPTPDDQPKKKKPASK